MKEIYGNTAASPVEASTPVNWSDIKNEHLVQFYESDSFLIECVAAFVTSGVELGETVVVLLTKRHRSELEERLAADGVNLPVLRAECQYITLDAEDVLQKVFVNGAVDEALLRALFSDLLIQVSRNPAGFRVHGEMVALLTRRGHHEAALQLEQLWERWREKTPFTLFCTYPIDNFQGDAQEAIFERICCEHTRVIPAESYTRRNDSESRLRTIARLQQQASSLHTEIAERHRAEAELSQSEARIRQLLTIMPGAVYTCDARGVITFFNQRAAEIWGSSPKIGDPDQKFCGAFKLWNTDGTPLSHAKTPMAVAIREGIPARDAEVVVERRDGSKVIVGVNIDPLFDDHGNITGAINVFQDITQRKQNELAARRLSAIVESSEDAIISKDLEGNIASWNDGAERLYGYPANEVIGKSVTILIPRERHSEESQILERIRRGERITHFETIRVRKDGARIEVSLTVSPVKDAAGNVIGISKIARDITDRKRVQEELKRSKEHLQAIIESSPECIKVVAADGTVSSMNAAGCAVIEADSGESMIGRSIYGVIAPESRDAFQQMHERVCGGAKERFEFQVVGLKGTRRWMETHAVPIANPVTGAFDHLAVTRDITHRKEAEEAMRQSESLFRELADSMPQIVWAAQPDGTVDYYNRKWYERTDATPGALGNQSWLPVLHPDDRDTCLERWKESVATGRPFEIECRFLFRETDQYRWHLGRALPVRDANGKIIRWFGTCTDIEDQKQAEEKLERVVAERTASLRDAVAQMEEFSYGVSHDLRGPLRAMQGYCHILLEDAASELSADNLAYLRRIAQSAERLDRLVQDVLAYTRVARTEMELTPVDLDSLIQDVLRNYTGEHHPVPEISIERPLGAVLAHEPSLVQCVANLVGNALKFVPEGSSPVVRIRAEKNSGKVRLWVEDNGIGIHPNHQSKIFTMFERAPEAARYPGTGVGLAIVRKTVQRMQGDLGLESELGKGSRFWIELQPA